MPDTNQEPSALLRDANGRPVALTGVSVRGRLSEMLASVEVEQRYLNPLDHNIEAVYTFPLPIGAVLLDLAVDIDGRTLTGQVVERKAAERQYEEAITDGDSAVMVTDGGNGLYTMNLGNLMAREPAVIRYRYAMPLAWLGDRLRLLIPTTVAPRYGNPGDAGLEDWEAPQTDLFVEYPFDLSIAIEGRLADCEVGSPTHPISVGRDAAGLNVRLARSACLDRDFVLTARATAPDASSLLITADGEERVAFASLRIPRLQREDDAPLCLKVVIDCSGSMMGSSIVQARKGAEAILEQLRPHDYVNITLFGSHHRHLFPTLRPCDAGTLELVRERLGHLEADMGGTETAAALDAAYKMSGKSRQRFADWQAEHCPGSRAAVLLITDGEIWGADDLLQRAARSGHRIFTVGVGTAVGEGLVTEVALATGGACEVVAPQEGMGERILAQFHRMRQPGIAPVELRWDETPLWQTPVPGHLFAGDTVTVFAGFAGKGPSQLSFAGGATGSVVAAHADMPDVPRLAAHARIGMLGETDEALALALRHQLLTRRTNFLVVAERKEKAEDLPELQKVPHMMPAGMFEHSGHVSYCLDLAAYSTVSDCAPSVVRRSPSRTADSSVDYCRSSFSSLFGDLCDDLRSLASPKKPRYSIAPNRGNGAVARKALEGMGLPGSPGSCPPGEFVARLNGMLSRFLRVSELPSSLDELETYGLPEAIAASLRHQVGIFRDDGAIAIAFLHALCESALSGHFERGLRRLVLTGWKQHCADPTLDAWLAQSLGATTESAWNWVALPLEEAAGAAP